MKYLGEPLNGFAPSSHGRRVRSLARTSLKVKVKGQRDKTRYFSALSAMCVRFLFGKTSLASSYSIIIIIKKVLIIVTLNIRHVPGALYKVTRCSCTLISEVSRN